MLLAVVVVGAVACRLVSGRSGRAVAPARAPARRPSRRSALVRRRCCSGGSTFGSSCSTATSERRRSCSSTSDRRPRGGSPFDAYVRSDVVASLSSDDLDGPVVVGLATVRQPRGRRRRRRAGPGRRPATFGGHAPAAIALCLVAIAVITPLSLSTSQAVAIRTRATCSPCSECRGPRRARPSIACCRACSRRRRRRHGLVGDQPDADRGRSGVGPTTPRSSAQCLLRRCGCFRSAMAGGWSPPG